jgi:hypothetical protein
MPRVAATIGAALRVLPAPAIASALVDAAREIQRASRRG